MAEFKPIETQEDLNKIISARVNEERERISRKYSAPRRRKPPRI